MPADLPCPTKPVLERFLLGELDHLSATDLDNLSRHVEQCAHCVALLESLRGDDSLVAVLRDPAMAVVEPRDEKVEGLIQQLCRPEELTTTLSGKGSPADHSPSETPAEDAEDVCRLLAPPERADEIGRLATYRVRRVLGVGGMGVVLLAFDPQLQRLVALKTLKPALAASAGARRRFLREAQAIAQVTHDHIVTILHVGEERGVPFLVMPFLPGETLDARLKREPTLAAEEVLRLGQQIVAGLAAAHAKGLIHRDIKPSNLWLEARQGDRETGRQGDKETRRGGNKETKEGANYLSPCLPVSLSPCLDFSVKILDFGLARAVGGDAQITQSGVVVGTPAYMAPEQARGEAVDQRSDLFSLGCVLYRACTGRLAFPGSNALATLLALAQTTPPPPAKGNPRLPPGLSELIMKLLARRPEDRFSSAREVAAALEAVAEGRAGPSPRRRLRLRVWMAAAAAAVLLGVLALAAFWPSPSIVPRPDTPADPVASELFAPAVHYSVGPYPGTVAVGDFNGDGKADLVVTNLNAHTVNVLPGNGDGTFRPPITTTVGEWFARWLTVADLNGDGKLDLVVAVDSGILVLLGKGDGTFHAPLSCDVGSLPTSVAVGDFDGDGKPDLVMVNEEGRAGIFLGKGDGTFREAVTSPVGKKCSAVVVGDFDRDGKPDLAVIDRGTNRIAVLRGKGDGTFDGALYYAIGSSLSAVALTATDLNGDGKLDLAVATSDGASVLLGNGDGTFQKAAPFSVGQTCHSVVAADLNGDGWPDLALTNAGDTHNPGRTITVLLNNGDGTFGNPLTYGVGRSPQTLAVGDFNGDGAPDLAVANLHSNTISILLHKPLPAYQAHLGPATDYAAGSEPRAVVVGDFNRDGKDDLVVADFAGQTVRIFHGRGDGTFLAASRHAAGKGPTAVAAADFNRDGRLDLAVANALDNTVGVLLGQGDGAFAAAVPYAVGKNPCAVAVGDFNGDGKPDLVTADYDSGTLSVLLGRGDGTFHEARRFPSGNHPRGVVAADVNGDGRLDLIVANRFQAGTVSVLLGKGDGTFAAPVPYPVGSFPVGVAVGDFNRDGKLDLAVANWGSMDVNVLLGKGDGTFRTAVNYATGAGNPFAITATDVNGDGKLDLLVATGGDVSVVNVLLGNGDGTFQTPPYYYHAGLDPKGLAVGRFRRGSRPDVVTANAHSGNVSVLLNRPAESHLTAKLNVKAIDADAMTCELACLAHNAQDPSNVADPNYRGTVHFHCSDPRAVLPKDYTFVPKDKGVHPLIVVLRTPGSQTITLTDAEGKLLPATVTVRVHKTTDLHYHLEVPTTAEAGKPFNVTVNILNQFHRWIDGYGGTVHFHCTDAAATLPADFTFDRAGVHIFPSSLILRTPGQCTITVTDTALPRLTASITVTVRPVKRNSQ